MLVVWYIAKNKSVASVDSVRWTLARFMYDDMSVHREKISKDKQGFIGSVLDRFGRDIRRFQLLFLSDADKSC